MGSIPLASRMVIYFFLQQLVQFVLQVDSEGRQKTQFEIQSNVNVTYMFNMYI